MPDPAEADNPSSADPPPRAARPPNGNHVLQALRAVDGMTMEGLALAARARETTPLQLYAELLGQAVDAAKAGDQAVRCELIDRIERAEAAARRAVALRNLHRRRTARNLLRAGERAYGNGDVSVEDYRAIVAGARARRELEHDDLDRRLAEVEGQLVDRVDG